MTPDELYTGYINAWKEFYPKETYEETADGIIFKTMTAFPLSQIEFEGFLIQDTSPRTNGSQRW